MKKAIAIASFTLLGLLLVSSTAAAEEGAAATARKGSAQLQLGTGLENKEIVGAAEKFEIAPDTKIWAWVKVTGSAGSGVKIAFVRGEKTVYEKELSIPSSPYRTNAFKTFRKGDGGEWSVVVTGADGSELARAKAEVTIK
jgi:hypothetical protein